MKFFVRRQRIFTIVNQEAALERPDVPDQTSAILSPRTLPRCDFGSPRDTQHGAGITGNVFERPPAQEGLSSTIFNNSKNLAFSSQGLGRGTTETARKRESEMKRETLNTSAPSPHFQSRSGNVIERYFLFFVQF